MYIFHILKMHLFHIYKQDSTVVVVIVW